MSGFPKKLVVVSVRMSAEELARIKAAARASGIAVSTFLRLAALERTGPDDA